MIIDIHTHIGHDKDGMSSSKEGLLKSMDYNKIDCSVVFPLDEINTDLIEASLSLLKLNNPRFISFLRFDPNTTTPEKLKPLLPKFRGVKLHPRSQNFNPANKKYFPLYEAIAASKRPLLIHTRLESNPYTDPVRIASLAPQFPKLNIILGHFADMSAEAFEAISKYDNLYTETSIHSITNVRIARVVKQIGADKVLFGSDVPYSDQEIELLKVRKAEMSDADREKILYRNASKLLNIQ